RPSCSTAQRMQASRASRSRAAWLRPRARRATAPPPPPRRPGPALRERARPGGGGAAAGGRRLAVVSAWFAAMWHTVLPVLRAAGAAIVTWVLGFAAWTVAAGRALAAEAQREL